MSQARLRTDESGVAVVEYVVLLGLLVSLVVMSVSVFGTALSRAWQGWAGMAANTPVPDQWTEPESTAIPVAAAPLPGDNAPADAVTEPADSDDGPCAKAAAQSQCAARNPNAGGDTPKRKP